MATEPSNTTPEAAGNSNGEGDKAKFTERETTLMVAAMMSLKSGAPEVDLDRLVINGRFNTKKTASNQWGALKKKIMAISGGGAEAGGAKGAAAGAQPTTAPPNTPTKKNGGGKKSASASPTKKRAAGAAAIDEDDEIPGLSTTPSPKKTKTPRSNGKSKKDAGGDKMVIKAEQTEGEEEITGFTDDSKNAAAGAEMVDEKMQL